MYLILHQERNIKNPNQPWALADYKIYSTEDDAMQAATTIAKLGISILDRTLAAVCVVKAVQHIAIKVQLETTPMA